MSSEIAHLFSRHAGEYDSWYETPSGRVVLEAEARLLDKVLPLGIGLDLGAGTGVFAERLSRTREIVCLDPSPGMLERARGRCLHMVLGVAEFPPFRQGSLDFIYMVTVLEFLQEPLQALSAAKQLLKPTAVLAILSVEKNSSWGRLYQELAAENKDPILAAGRFYSEGEVEGLLGRAGYHVYARGATLDYEPLTVPDKPPKIYVNERCPSCGVFLLLAAPPPRQP
ncbi:MAG: class I SAM-dependent methyltransferase [Infirmifilum sp.]